MSIGIGQGEEGLGREGRVGGDNSFELLQSAAVLHESDVARGPRVRQAGRESELLQGDVPPDGG